MRNLSKSPTFVFAIFFLAGIKVYAQTSAPTALQSLADAETAFAQTAAAKGTRDAFLSFLADNAVIFEPGPVNGKKTWEKRAPASGLLTWQQNFLAVSRSGDLGYTIGPWEFKQNPTDTDAKAYGQFLSVWKKRKEGPWKVVLDAGVDTPRPLGKPAAAIFSTPPPVSPKIDPAVVQTDVRKVARRFALASAKDSGLAIIAFASEDIHVLRDGVFPATGEDGAQLMLASDHTKTTFQPAGGDLSESNDLGYEYGEYVTERGDGPERGSYVTIWKRNIRATWRLAVDWRKPRGKAANTPTDRANKPKSES